MTWSFDGDDFEAMKQRIRALEETLDHLIEMLVGREHLTEGHRRLLDKIADRAARPQPKAVKLRVYSGDKYQVANPDVDCVALMHLCGARCCQLDVKLTEQDIEEGKLEWRIDEPYLLKKRDDGLCAYLGEGGACGVYDCRPASCREFDCRDDKRIWIDFENKIPVPFDQVRTAPGAREDAE